MGVLDAIPEVENALVQYDAATSATTAAADAARLYAEARDLTRIVYEGGDAALGDLIDAEGAIASADRRYQRVRAFVELDVALGPDTLPVRRLDLRSLLPAPILARFRHVRPYCRPALLLDRV